MDDTAVGRRIRAARVSRGLSQKAVAESLGLDNTAMSKIENGARSVSSGELADLADVLGTSMRDLLGTRKPLSALQFAHRLGEADESSRSTREARDVLIELLELKALLDELEVPEAPAPHADLPQPSSTADPVQAGRVMARRVRTTLGIGDQPLGDVVDLLEHFGIEVVGRPLGDGEDALAGMCTDHPTLRATLVNTDQWGTRQRFTLAHEFGHILFGDASHRWHDDSASALATWSGDPVEIRANAFAAELLLPLSAIKGVVRRGDLNERLFADLLFDYGLSVASLTYRLKDAGVLEANEVSQWMDLVPSRLAFAHNRKEDHSAHDRARGAFRAPTGIYERAMMAYRSGRLGIRPLAGLTGDDPERLRAQLAELGLGPDFSDSVDVLQLL